VFQNNVEGNRQRHSLNLSNKGGCFNLNEWRILEGKKIRVPGKTGLPLAQ
jgi:hypothetical protein